MRIGDVFLRVLADALGFEADVVKTVDAAGAKAEKSLGARLGGALKTNGLKVFGAAASAAFALASAGAAKLSDIAARFQAETGASADEAKHAAKVVNEAAGRERLALEDVADAAIAVRTNLKATGDQADHLTNKFARYGRVTKQGPAAAVADFDDILDAWNLTADATDGLMDKLIVSNQKYGGSITADQKALAAMAPQMKALNLQIDDGIALLDLFKESGLDAAQIPKALNSAIAKLDGKPLGDFIAELASIEDPGKRAQRAIEIFGSKAGVNLANAIKPGMTSLADLRISTEESAGALDKAADVLDSTFGAKFQRMLSEAAAKIREFGSDWGETFTGIASLASLGATFGLDTLVAKLGKPLATALLEAGKKGGEALIDGIGTATGAAGTVIGNLVAQALDPHNPFLNGVIGRSAQRVAGLWSTAYLKWLIAGDAIASALSSTWTSVAGTGSKATMAAAAAGRAAGVAFQTAFLLGIAAVIAQVGDEQLTGLKADIAKRVQDALADGTTQGIEDARTYVQGALRGAKAGHLGDDLVKFYEGQLAILNASLATRDLAGLHEFADRGAAALITDLRAAQPGVAQAAAALAQEVPTAFEKGQALLAGAARAFLALPIAQQLLKLGPEGVRAGAETALGIASGLRDKRSAIDAAVEQLKTDIKNQMSRKTEIAHDIGLLFGRTIARGLKSSDPVVKAQAQGTRALIEAELLETVKAGGVAGEKIQKELESKLHSKDPDVKAQAQRTKSLIDEALKATPGKNPGDVIGDQLATDLANSNTQLGKVSYSLGRVIALNLLRGVQGSGVSVPRAALTTTTGRNVRPGIPEFDEGTWSVPGDQFALVHNREIIVPQASSDAIRSGAAVLSSTGVTGAGWGGGPLIGHLEVDARGHDNPEAVGDAVAHAVGDEMSKVFRDQSLRGVIGLQP